MTSEIRTKEGTMQETRRSFAVRFIAVTGILSAAAFVLQLIEFPLPFLIPSFIKLDFSDLPALIGSFSLGPVGGIGCHIRCRLFISFVEISRELKAGYLGSS